MRLFWTVNETERFESPRLTPLDFCLWSRMEAEVEKRQVDTWDELLARILDAAAPTKKRDQLGRTTRDFHTWAAKCMGADSGIFEHLLWTVTNLSFRH
jgi:hypothetical protein